MGWSSFMSADLYSDLTIRFGMKSYPKLTPYLLKSLLLLQSYGEVIFHVSWFVQWPCLWIGHGKLSQSDPSFVEIPPVVAKLWRGLLPDQLICTLTSPLDLAWKTTPNWHIICWNTSNGCQVMGKSSSMSADVYTDLTIGLGMKNYPKLTPHMLKSLHWLPSYGEVFFHVSWQVYWPHH